jgi:MFS family permease
VALVLVCFFIQVGFYGLNLWLPHLVKDTIGGSYLVVGAITAIPYVFAIAGLWFNAHFADRSGRYSVMCWARWRWGAVALVLSVAFGSYIALSVFLISIAMMGELTAGGHLAERWSAKKFVGIMVLIWGVFAVASGLVQNYTQLLIVADREGFLVCPDPVGLFLRRVKQIAVCCG